MSRPPQLLSEAYIELETAKAWYDDERTGLGDELINAVDQALRSIGRSPGAGSPVDFVQPGPEVRRIAVARFPYQVVYAVVDGEPLVIAVAHERRRPGYWKARITDA